MNMWHELAASDTIVATPPVRCDADIAAWEARVRHLRTRIVLRHLIDFVESLGDDDDRGRQAIMTAWQDATNICVTNVAQREAEFFESLRTPVEGLQCLALI